MGSALRTWSSLTTSTVSGGVFSLIRGQLGVEAHLWEVGVDAGSASPFGPQGVAASLIFDL